MFAELSTNNVKLGDNFTGSYCFWESRFTLRLNAANRLYKKMLRTKIVRN